MKRLLFLIFLLSISTILSGCSFLGKNNSLAEKRLGYGELYELSYLANLAYVENEMEISQKAQLYGKIEVLQGDKEHFGFLVTNSDRDFQILVIKGVEDDDWKDTIKDAATAIRFPVDKDPKTKIEYHKGFLSYSNNIWEVSSHLLKKDHQIYLVGHSMGGAAVTIIGKRLLDLGYAVSVISFAQPPTVGKEYVEQFKDFPLIRVFANNDIFVGKDSWSSHLYDFASNLRHVGESIVLYDRGTQLTFKNTKYHGNEGKDLSYHDMHILMEILHDKANASETFVDFTTGEANGKYSPKGFEPHWWKNLWVGFSAGFLLALVI